MVKNQRNSCCHMGCPPMFVHLHFHRGYSLGPQKSKPLIIYGIVSLPRMRWSGATGAIARGKRVSTACGRRRRSVPAWHWICGGKPKPKAVNKPSPHSIVHGLDKPGVFTTVSDKIDGGAHRLLRSWQGYTLSTSVEEVHDHDNKAGKYYWAYWFVRD